MRNVDDCILYSIFQGLLNPGQKSGIAIIISNDDWPSMNPRRGNDKDVESLRSIFELFSIMTLHLHNKTVAEIKYAIGKGKPFKLRINYKINILKFQLFLWTIQTHRVLS